jgi:hypothetical protein
MQMRLLRLAIVATAIPTLTACQTPSLPFFSEEKTEAVKPVEDLRVALLIEFCRGQTPESVSRAEFDAWPQAAKDYATSNVNQWLAAGCRI